MAFTNYLTTSIICTLLFKWVRAGVVRKLERAQTYLVVLSVWALQLLWSKPWLAHFRIGPFEWAWRSLTYWERHPMRISRVALDAGPTTAQFDEYRGNKVVRYDKGGHGAEIFDVHPKFMGVISDWYVTTLIKTPGRAPEVKRVAVAKDIQILTQIDEPGGVEKVSKMLKEARAKDPKATLFPEDLVNVLGYEHIQSGDIEGAVAILKLNVEAYPNSANVYDSVSDAYLAEGQKALARENAKRALEMLASDKSLNEQRKAGIRRSAEQKLKQLGDVPK